MQKIEVGSNKALAFILGLAYGYKNAEIELNVLSIEEFSEDKHKDDKIYYTPGEKLDLKFTLPIIAISNSISIYIHKHTS